jgi:hypothetical protein
VRRHRGFVVVVATAAVLTLTAADTPAAPGVSFTIAPPFVACGEHEAPAKVRVSWRIVNPVTSATITGAVNGSGRARGPIHLAMKHGKRGITGTRLLRLPCSSTAQTLELVAVGPGGTTKRVATLNENRAS